MHCIAQDGQTTFRNSFIRTKGFTKESKTRQMAGRGTFGNHKLPGFLGNFLSTNIKNVANTNVIYWGGRLLALWEGGLPYKLDPKTLRTDSKEYTMRGLLKKGETLTAHPRQDSKRDRLIAFSVKQDPSKSAITRIFEFDNTLTSVSERTFESPGVCAAQYLHSYPYIIFYLHSNHSDP
jgi:all-trans-8'-apo-beta-carotenal 15,15'-oxygenase